MIILLRTATEAPMNFYVSGMPVFSKKWNDTSLSYNSLNKSATLGDFKDVSLVEKPKHLEDKICSRWVFAPVRPRLARWVHKRPQETTSH